MIILEFWSTSLITIEMCRLNDENRTINFAKSKTAFAWKFVNHFQTFIDGFWMKIH